MLTPQQLFDEYLKLRKIYNLSTPQQDLILASQSQKWAENMASRNKMSHDYGAYVDEIVYADTGVPDYGTIRLGNEDVRMPSCFIGWLHSTKGHRETLLGTFKWCGFGMARNNSSGQDFACGRFTEGNPERHADPRPGPQPPNPPKPTPPPSGGGFWAWLLRRFFG